MFFICLISKILKVLIFGWVMVTDFAILVMIHFVSDFFLQPSSWAIKKVGNFKYTFYHSVQYTIPFLIAFYFMSISFWWILLIFGSHLAIDGRQFLRWYNKRVNGDKNCPFWVMIVQDQVLHVLVLMVVAW